MHFIKIFILFFVFIFNINLAFAAITGGVEKKEMAENSNKVVDSKTKKPVQNAKIKIPKLEYSTKTDGDGKFYLDAQINGTSVMSVEKEGYRPFSLTIDQSTITKPIVLGIEKTDPKDIILETNLIHIGDDMYSACSANAEEFKIKSVGFSVTKDFILQAPKNNENVYLVIGSVIGVDTLLAQQLGQSQALNAYASPPEVFFNGQKIAEIKCNGDGQKIKLPISLIAINKHNEITIRCGKNLFQYNYIDYDDIEMINLFIEYGK